MKNYKIILIDTGSKSNILMMSDIGSMPNAEQISIPYALNNAFTRKLMRLHFSYSINCRIELPFKNIWKRACVLYELPIQENVEYIVIIVNNAIHKLSTVFLNQLSQRPDIHMVCLLLDSYDKMPKLIPRMINRTNFEWIYSFQRSDCDKYGFLYTNQIYSKAQLPSEISQLNDLYFIGLDKGRIETLYAIYQRLTRSGLRCDFNVIVKEKHLQVYAYRYKGLHLLTERIEYDEILKGIANSRGILELCQEGQDGLTLRFYEAIFYNRLLITNNKTAVQNKYFSTGYIQLIKQADDINIDQLLVRRYVDYGYQNEYSPVNFVNDIIHRLESH